MNTVHKFSIPLQRHEFGSYFISIPSFSFIRKVGEDGENNLCIWIELDPEDPKEDILTVKVVPTGGIAPPRDRWRYLDTVMRGSYVWHVYIQINSSPPA